MANKKTRAELLAENRLLKRGNAARTTANVLETAIKWGSLVLIVRYASIAIGELAGEQTNADIALAVFTDLRVSETVAWIFGGSGVGYGLLQRSLRRRTISRLGPRVERLEAVHDPNRSSSNLDPAGGTAPEDR